MHTLQSTKFIEGIKPGDRIDVRDCEDDWFEARILSVSDKIAKCHFINYSSKWDCNIVLSPDNVALRNTHSKSTGKADNYKYLLECVHELLYLRQEDDHYMRSANEIGIAPHEVEQFINTGEPQNDEHKIKILKWVRTQSNLMRLELKILEMDDALIYNLIPPPDICDKNSYIYYAGSKRIRTPVEDVHTLPAAKKRRISIDIDEESDYSLSSSSSDDNYDISDSESDSQTNGTKITFIKMSHKQLQFEGEQKAFQHEILKQREVEKAAKAETIEKTKKTDKAKPKKRKYKTRRKMVIDENEMDDFSEFKIVLSDANLNLNHSIYPNRKFRGIAKSGRRWRARSCIAGKTQYGETSFYNPFLAGMEYDRMIRANRQKELTGAIKTKTQIILNFPYGLQQQTIRIHKLFEKELQEMDQEQIKRTFGIKYKKRKRAKDGKRKEEPIIDNKGLATKLPIQFLKKMDSALYQTDRLKPFGPTHIVDTVAPVITHYVSNKTNAKSNKNICQWSNGRDACCATSLFFGYTTLHIA